MSFRPNNNHNHNHNHNHNPADSSLWRDVCLASAWIDRAKSLLASNSISQSQSQSQSTPPNDIFSCAQNALSLYQSCHRRVRRRSTSVSNTGGDGGSSSVIPSPASSSSRRKHLSSIANNSNNTNNNNAASFTINLELRMAQTLRFLAMIHAMKNSRRTGGSNDDNNDDDGDGTNNNNNGGAPITVKDEEEDLVNLELAIKYHDDAVSLLVGVFDDDDDDDDDEVNNPSLSEGRQDRESQPSSYEEHDPDQSVSSAISEDNDDSRMQTGMMNGRVLLAICVPNNEKLSEHILGGNTGIKSSPMIQATFILPSEDQRVRAIAVSLNALAQLHASCGDDRAAMDAYREALEILRAATEEGTRDDEEEYDEEEGDYTTTLGEEEDERWSEGQHSIGHTSVGVKRGGADRHSAPTRAEALLSATLMNVGNYHLRRDELDAALNAHSTAWALHTGHALEETSVDSSGLALPHLHHSPRGKGKPSTAMPPRSHCSVGALAALNNLGIVHERRGELEDALLCHEQVRCARIFVDAPAIEIANSWINVGNCLQRLQDFAKAGEAYAEAVFIFRQELQKLDEVHDNSSASKVRVYRSLAGALRNWGTCYWKQHQISEAIIHLNDAVETKNELISCLLASGLVLERNHEVAHQAKESMAQLLGFLGCLYIEEHHTTAKKAGSYSFENAKDAFNMAINIYLELGFNEHHPSMVWARRNLDSVLLMAERHRNPPPPPPTPPPAKKRSPQSSPPPKVNHVISGSQRHTSRDDDEDSVFSGVEDDDSGSKELDEFLSSSAHEEVAKGPPVDQSPFAPERGQEAELAQPFDEEVDLDEGFENIEAHHAAPINLNLPVSTPIKDDDINNNDNITMSNERRGYPESLLSEHSGHDQEVKVESTDANINECSENVRKQKDNYGDNSAQAADALVALACQYWEKGDRKTATELLTEAHAVYNEKFGESKEVAMVLKNLGDLNKEDEKFDAAKHLYMEALHMEEEVYGYMLPQTLNAVGILCLELDDFRSAMEYHRRALQVQKKQTSRGEHSKYEMYETLVRIGNVYYSERNNLSNIRSNGVDYKEFIASGFLGWIANAHDMRGEFGKSKQFYEELLQISMTKDTKEAKKETALTLNRLGSLSRELGLYDEAMDFHQRALHLQQSTSSAAKAMTAETCVLMGMVKSKLGEYRKALDLFEDSLLVLKSSLGKRHSSVATTLAQIGAVLTDMGDYEKAMSILTEAERSQISTVGEDSRDTLETQAMIGRVLCRIGDFDMALQKLRHVAKKQTSLFGSSHPSIAETKQFMGEVFLEQGMITEARAMYIDSYNMRKLFFGMDQIHIAESMVDVIRARDGKPEQALAIYKNAMEVYKEYLSDDHIQIGRLLVFEGDAYAELLDFSSAINRYQKAMEIFRNILDEGHVTEADLSVNFGKVLLRKCDYDGAKDHFHRALQIYQMKLPTTHPKIAKTLAHLDRVEQEEELCV